MAALGLKLADLYTAAAAPKRANDRPAKPTAKPRRAEPREVYPYTDADGHLLYEVLRFEPKDFRQRRPDPDNPGKYLWSLNGVDRVLYRLPAISAARAAERPKAVWLVEGEKDVHALEKLGLVATTMAGGAGKWLPQYTAALAGGPTFIIPDNDEPGRRHAHHAAKQLHPEAWVVELPDLPPKGDVSDWLAAGGTRDQLIALAREAMAGPNIPTPTPTAPTAAPAPTPEPPVNAWPFRALGYDQGAYYFYSPLTRQTHVFTANTFRNRVALFSLAPMDWWNLNYAGDKGTDWTRAVDDLMRAAHTAGLFDPARRRGRGAWYDDGRTVIHQGDSLVVDGKPTTVNAIQSKFLYELTPRLSWPAADPADDDLGAALADLFSALVWDTPLGGALLAGWTFLAPVCGILRWRPHVWLTGASGTGKTWVQENIVAPLVGPLALRVQSCTTEAGLRQTLGQDARPVIFDEAELDDERGTLNMQRVLELARQASSETGAMIAKGTAHGTAQHYSIRSMFLLSSIAVGVRRRADESRVSVLSLGRPAGGAVGAAHFRDLQAAAARLITPDTAAALIARAARLAPLIRTVSGQFAEAIAQQTSSRRLGDQLGTLLAGSWCLTESKPPSEASVAALVARVGTEALMVDESTSDERACLAALLERTVRVEAIDTANNRPRGAVERSIGELVDLAAGRARYTDVLPDDALECLRRHGLRADADGLSVSTSHSAVAALLRGTPYANQWGRFLRRLPGTNETKIKWPGGTNTRAVVLPWSVFGYGKHVEPDDEETF